MTPTNNPRTDRGRNLIFLISQPRAGSTLLQRVLGGHPAIHTVSEPWLMLHPVYALRGVQAEYGGHLAHPALLDFLRALPAGEDTYLEAVRLMCSYLYDSALEQANKSLFLDKTPRYYLIVPELLRIFPEARFIIMLRNPLAVVASIVSTWTTWHSSSLSAWRDDLLRAPELLLAAISQAGKRGIVVRYEEFVEGPEIEVTRLCQHLGIPFHTEMIDYAASGLPRWALGDQVGLYSRTQPDGSRSLAWTRQLRQPRTWRAAHGYLHLLGRETVNALGYRFDEVAGLLDQTQPTLTRRLLTPTVPFALSIADLRPRQLMRAARWTRS
jgi:Sulfotransferase family